LRHPAVTRVIPLDAASVPPRIVPDDARDFRVHRVEFDPSRLTASAAWEPAMDRILAPQNDLKLRYIVLGVLLLPILPTFRYSYIWPFVAAFLPLMLTGTYRITKIRGDRLTTQLRMGHVPFNPEKVNLPSVVVIHTRYHEAQTGVGTLLLFGPVQLVFSLLFDFLIPALGGGYEIWLETAKGREVLVWNGYRQSDFEENLNLLRSRTGAEVRIR
jgi:hypothetical protein